MPIQYPVDRKEVFNRIGTDIQAELPQSEPFLRNSYLRALAIGYAGGIYDEYKTIQALQQQMFPDTATAEFADRWAAFKNIFRNPASTSSGYITITGTPGTTIGINTLLRSGSGELYSTQDTYVIVAQITLLLSLTRSGTTAIFTTQYPHNLASGNSVTFYGADQPEYNGTFTIVVTSETSGTYQISGTPATPATGFILAALNNISALVRSLDYGSVTNLDNGSELFFETIQAGVDTSAFVQFRGIEGGEDLEIDANFRTRYLYAYAHPISYFNVSEITLKCLEVAGVTRVFVQSITPLVGQVTIYFMRDNDTSPIPSATEVLDVKNKLMSITPAHVDPNDVIVLAPKPKSINFLFSGLTPNTDEMLTAIRQSLIAFFSEVPVVGQNLSKNSYTSAIYYTVDPTTGDFVQDFTLISPVGDIVVGSGEIPILGTVQKV